MMGFGSYGYGGSSSASNLSALAPPFTVDRSAPKINANPPSDFNVDLPYAMSVPLNSSMHNWVPPHYPASRADLGNDSIHGSNGYNYPVSQPFSSTSSTLLPSVSPTATAGVFSYGQCSEGAAGNHVEAKPYYPSLVSQGIHNDSPVELPRQAGYDLLSSSYVSALNGSSRDECGGDSLAGQEYAPQWSGVWNGLAEWNSDRHVEIDGNFYPREAPNVAGPSNYHNYLNQGTNASKGLTTFEELPSNNHLIIQEKGVGCASRKLFDDKSYSGQNPYFVPVGYSNIMESTLLPQTRTKEPFVDYAAKPTNSKMPYGTYNEGLVEHDINMNLSTSNALDGPASRLPTDGTNYLAPNTSSLKAMNVTNDVADMNSVWNRSAGTKESPFLQTSDAQGQFDGSQISSHLNRKDHFLAESSPVKNSELPVNRNASNNISDTFFEANSEMQVPQERVGLFSVPSDCNEVVTSAEFSETLDHYNTSVDSPCWKGVPFSRFNPFKVSEADTPQQLKREAGYGLSLHGPQTYNVGDGERVSCLLESENTFFYGSGHAKNGLVPPVKKPSVDHAMEAGFCYSKSTHEPRKDYTHPCKSVGDSGFKPFHPFQLPEDGVVVPEKIVTSGSNVADSRRDVNDDLVGGSTDIPFRASESILRSPPSSENAPAEPLKLPVGQSTSKIDVKVLIKTMHSLSEMLLVHCSNDACIVKEKDLPTLKSVINNLETCVRGNLQQKPSVQESMFSQGDIFQSHRWSPDPCKGVSVDGTWVTAAVVMNVQNQHDGQRVVKATKDHIMSAKKDGNMSDTDIPRGAEDFINDDKMTQSIKNVLNEYFDEEEETDPQILLYKNLWLEAEAAICSINYKARFNRMKIEMEKNKLLKAKDVVDNATDLKKLPNHKVSPVLSTDNNDLAREVDIPTAAANGHADDVLGVLKCGFDYSNSTNAVNEQDSANSPDLTNGEQFPDGPKDNLNSDVSRSDDVMSRYRILKGRADGSNIVNTMDAQDMWNSGVPFDSNKVEKSGTEAKGGQTPDISVPDSSPVSSRMSQADNVEPSVLARLHILKSRTDNSTTLDADLDLGGKSNYWSVTSNGLWEVKSNAEQHRCCEDESNVPSNRPPGWYGSSSSDWEHVLKEDLPLPGQN